MIRLNRSHASHALSCPSTLHSHGFHEWRKNGRVIIGTCMHSPPSSLSLPSLCVCVHNSFGHACKLCVCVCKLGSGSSSRAQGKAHTAPSSGSTTLSIVSPCLTTRPRSHTHRPQNLQIPQSPNPHPPFPIPATFALHAPHAPFPLQPINQHYRLAAAKLLAFNLLNPSSPALLIVVGTTLLLGAIV